MKTTLKIVKDIPKKNKADQSSKNAEEAHTHNEVFIESIINASPDVIYIYDIEERKNIYVNHGIQKNLGYSGEEIKQMGSGLISILMHPEDFEFYLSNTFPKYATLKNKEIIIHEFRMKDKKGQWRFFSCKESIFLRKPDKTPKQIFGMISDITESKKLNEKIILNEKRLLKAQQIGKLGYWQQDLDSDRIWASKEAMRIYGFPPVEGELQKDKIVACIIDREIVKQATIDLIKNYKEYNIEIRINPADGSAMKYISAIAELEKDKTGKPVRIVGTLQDITDKKIAGDALKKEKELSDSVINSLPGIFYLADTTPRLVRWNKAFETYSGYSAEELENIVPINLFAPEDHSMFKQAMHKTYSKGSADIEVRLFTKDRKKIPFYFTGIAIKYEGKPAILGTGLDITERKKAEDAIKKSEEKYRTLLEQASDAIFIADANGKFITVNSSACKLSQYSEKELLKMTFYDFAVLEDIQKDPFHFDELKLGKTVNTERLMKRRNDAPLFVEVTAKLISNGRLLTIVRDITDRKKNQQALVESENHLRTILQTEPECIKLLNIKGQLLDMNPAGLAMIEASHIDQVRNQSIINIIDKPYRKAFSRLTKNVFNGRSEQLDFKITGLKGTRRWLQTHAVPLTNSEGKIISLLGVTRDITEQKNAEENLKRSNEELRRLSTHLQNIREEERTNIAREIHDELGQQLTALKMDISWINKKLINGDKKVTDKINDSLDLIDVTIDTVRKIAAELRPSIIDDLGLAEAINWQGREFSRRTGISVKFSTNVDEVKFSPDISINLFRIFQESLTNITRHANASQVICNLKKNAHNLILNITDNGVGFNKDLQGKNRTFGILGIKERVGMLKGTYDIASETGKGTMVSVEIPYPKINKNS